MEPLVAEAADDLAARLPEDEVADFITAFSQPLPVWAISRVLGLPDEMRGDIKIKRWTDAVTAAVGAQLPPEKWPQVEHDLLDYQRTMLAEYERRRTEPIPGLLQAARGGCPRSGADLVARASGHDTGALARGKRKQPAHAGQHGAVPRPVPEEWQRVRDDPSRIDAVVEETLRLASPTQAVFRKATADTELGGVAIPARSQVVLSIMAANLDGAVRGDAESFDPDRADPGHVSFGAGIHTCVGARLSRLEARHALRALPARRAARGRGPERASLRPEHDRARARDAAGPGRAAEEGLRDAPMPRQALGRGEPRGRCSASAWVFQEPLRRPPGGRAVWPEYGQFLHQ